MTSASSLPYVILNAAMSLDGKIATSTCESRLSSPEDLRRVHRLRASVNGIMIGVGTLLVDNPKLTVRFFRAQNPRRIIVDGRARTPVTAHVVRTAFQTPTIVAVTSRASSRRVNALKSKGVTVLTCGSGQWVSLPILLRQLRRMSVNRLLLEGGGKLNWSMLSRGFVDEIFVAVAPMVLGGAEAVTLVEGEGFGRISDAVRLRFLGVEKYGADLVLSYKVLQQSSTRN